MIILIVATYMVGKPPWGVRLGYAALAFAVVLIFGTALAFLLSAINVYLRDVAVPGRDRVDVCSVAAPIVYSWSQVHSTLGGGVLERLYLSNPVTLAVMGFQRAFWVAGDAKPGATPAGLALYVGVMIGVGLVILWLCQRVFARLQGNFAQEL